MGRFTSWRHKKIGSIALEELIVFLMVVMLAVVLFLFMKEKGGILSIE